MSDSFVKPFEYLYEESDSIIRKGIILPMVNQLGKTDNIVEPSILPPGQPLIASTHVSDSIPDTIKTPDPTPTESHPDSRSPTIQPKGRNIQVGVSDSVASTDK